MPTAEKEQAIVQAREWYEKSVGLVFADYRGLKVKEMQQLRAQLKAKGGELHVVKNTLFRRAAGEVVDQFPAEFHNGPTAIAFVFENESECAKVIWDYSAARKTLQVKGGYFNGRVFDSKGVEKLSKLPTREVLIAQLIGTIVAPLTNLVSVIDSLYAQPIRTVYAVADKLGAAPSEPKVEEAAPVESAAPAGAPTADAAPAAEEAPSEETTSEAPDRPESAEMSEASGDSSSSSDSAEPIAESTESTEPAESAEPVEGDQSPDAEEAPATEESTNPEE